MRITELLSTTRARVSLATALIVAIAAAIVGAYVIRGDRAESPGATSPPPAMEMNGQARSPGCASTSP